jgi:hypothetical protein
LLAEITFIPMGLSVGISFFRSREKALP